MAINKRFAPCNNKECSKRESCYRFLDEPNVNYINYKYFIKEDGICKWYEEIKADIVEVKSNTKETEKETEKVG